MLRKLTYHSIIPAFLFLLLVAVPAAEATDEERNMSHPVTLQDGNPALSRAVKYELGKVEALNTPDVQVVSEGGTVKLVGKVKTRHQRAEAERIARDVDGVDRVVNDLWVRDPSIEKDHSK